MEIAVIGTGNVGRALARSLTGAGHSVTFAARDHEKTRKTAGELGAKAAVSPKEAISSADVVVLAVPYGALEPLAQSIGKAAAGKVVIDVTNPMNSEGGRSAAEQLAALLPDAAVVKAFNTLFASNQANPRAHGMAVDALFATDDARARAIVRDLITSLGFRAIDAGPLANAREMEALAALNIKLNAANNGAWNTAIVFVAAPAAATTEPLETVAR